MSISAILRDVASRSDRDGSGLSLASDYVKVVRDCLGEDANLGRLLGPGVPTNWDSVVKSASRRLVYRSPQMKYLGKNGLGPTPNACMDFACVLTATSEDRDKDVMEAAGAEVDPMMPLLMHHLPTAPIGRLIEVLEQDDMQVKTHFAIADTAMGNDAAQLVEFEALRISHGFVPIEMTPRRRTKSSAKEGASRPQDGPGWHVLRFKVYEGSLVSIPSNEEAVILLHSRNKFHHPLTKRWAGEIAAHRPRVVVGGFKGEVVGNLCRVDEGEAGGGQFVACDGGGGGSGSSGSGKESDRERSPKERSEDRRWANQQAKIEEARASVNWMSKMAKQGGDIDENEIIERLSKIPAKEVRKIAEEHGYLRGRNKSDTVENIRRSISARAETERQTRIQKADDAAAKAEMKGSFGSKEINKLNAWQKAVDAKETSFLGDVGNAVGAIDFDGLMDKFSKRYGDTAAKAVTLASVIGSVPGFVGGTLAEAFTLTPAVAVGRAGATVLAMGGTFGGTLGDVIKWSSPAYWGSKLTAGLVAAPIIAGLRLYEKITGNRLGNKPPTFESLGIDKGRIPPWAMERFNIKGLSVSVKGDDADGGFDMTEEEFDDAVTEFSREVIRMAFKGIEESDLFDDTEEIDEQADAIAAIVDGLNDEAANAKSAFFAYKGEVTGNLCRVDEGEPGGGQFVACDGGGGGGTGGSSESSASGGKTDSSKKPKGGDGSDRPEYKSASDSIRGAMRGNDFDKGKLASDLAKIPVAGLKNLAKEHGIKVDGKTKAKIVDAIKADADRAAAQFTNLPKFKGGSEKPTASDVKEVALDKEAFAKVRDYQDALHKWDNDWRDTFGRSLSAASTHLFSRSDQEETKYLSKRYGPVVGSAIAAVSAVGAAAGMAAGTVGAFGLGYGLASPAGPVASAIVGSLFAGKDLQGSADDANGSRGLSFSGTMARFASGLAAMPFIGLANLYEKMSGHKLGSTKPKPQAFGLRPEQVPEYIRGYWDSKSLRLMTIKAEGEAVNWPDEETFFQEAADLAGRYMEMAKSDPPRFTDTPIGGELVDALATIMSGVGVEPADLANSAKMKRRLSIKEQIEGDLCRVDAGEPNGGQFTSCGGGGGGGGSSEDRSEGEGRRYSGDSRAGAHSTLASRMAEVRSVGEEPSSAAKLANDIEKVYGPDERMYDRSNENRLADPDGKPGGWEGRVLLMDRPAAGWEGSQEEWSRRAVFQDTLWKEVQKASENIIQSHGREFLSKVLREDYGFFSGSALHVFGRIAGWFDDFMQGAPVVYRFFNRWPTQKLAIAPYIALKRYFRNEKEQEAINARARARGERVAERDDHFESLFRNFDRMTVKGTIPPDKLNDPAYTRLADALEMTKEELATVDWERVSKLIPEMLQMVKDYWTEAIKEAKIEEKIIDWVRENGDGFGEIDPDNPPKPGDKPKTEDKKSFGLGNFFKRGVEMARKCCGDASPMVAFDPADHLRMPRFEGSYEWVEETLDRQAKSYLGQTVTLEGWESVFVVATYPGSCLLCKFGNMMTNQPEFYRASWSEDTGTPTLTGTPEKVSVIAAIKNLVVASMKAARIMRKAYSVDHKTMLKESHDLCKSVCDYEGVPETAKDCCMSARGNLKGVLDSIDELEEAAASADNDGEGGVEEEGGKKPEEKKRKRRWNRKSIGDPVLTKEMSSKLRRAYGNIEDAARTDGIPRPAKSMCHEAKGYVKMVMDENAPPDPEEEDEEEEEEIEATEEGEEEATEEEKKEKKAVNRLAAKLLGHLATGSVPSKSILEGLVDQAAEALEVQQALDDAEAAIR